MAAFILNCTAFRFDFGQKNEKFFTLQVVCHKKFQSSPFNVLCKPDQVYGGLKISCRWLDSVPLSIFNLKIILGQIRAIPQKILLQHHLPPLST